MANKQKKKKDSTKKKKDDFVRYYVELEVHNPKGSGESFDLSQALSVMQRHSAVFIEGIAEDGRRTVIKDMRKDYRQRVKEERSLSFFEEGLRNFTVHIPARMTSDEKDSQPMDVVLEIPIPNAETWDEAFRRTQELMTHMAYEHDEDWIKQGQRVARFAKTEE